MSKYLMMVLFFVIFSHPLYANSFSVQPLYLEFNANQKIKKQNFEISIQAEKEMTVKLSLFQAVQQRDGKLGFVELPEDSEKIITFNESKYTFKRPGEWIAKGEITFLGNNKDTKIYAVMIENEKNGSEAGVGINVRYAVVLKIQNDHKKSQLSGKFESFTINKEKDVLFIKSVVKNNSAKDFKIKAEARIRDENNKTVDQIELRSLAAWQKNEIYSIIFPGAEVELVGKITKIKAAGDYKFTIYGAIMGGSTLTLTDTLTVKNDELPKVEEAKGVYHLPEKIEVIKTKAKISKFRIQLVNDSGEQVKIKFPEINHSSGTKVTFKPEILDIKAGANKTAVINCEITTGEKLNVEAQIFDKSGNQIKVLPIEINFSNKE